MNYGYTLDPNADEPIMLIDTHIGNDDEDGQGVSGAQFCRELMFLDSLNKSRIQVWINSVGGSVLDAQQIYNTILKVKTKVDTYCVGMAASSAGFIFQAGRKRYMMDGTNLMMHNPYNPDGEVTKVTHLLKDSIVTMIASRSGIEPNQVSALMDNTTWYNAQECKANGLCDEVENLGEFNKARKVSVTDLNSAVKEYAQILNKVIENKKPKTMIKVANKFNLNPSLVNIEDAILLEVEKIENSHKEASTKLAEKEAELSKLEADLEKVTNECKTLKDAAELEAKNKAELEATDVKNQSKVFVAELVKLGKIENKAEVIEKMETKAGASKEAFEEVKDLFENIPAKIKAPDFNQFADKKPSTYTAQDIMNRINEKNNK